MSLLNTRYSWKHVRRVFAANLVDFDYHANTIGALLVRLRDLEASYDNLSVLEPMAEFMKGFPSSGSSSHEPSVVQNNVKSLKEVPKCGNSDKECSSIVQPNTSLVERVHEYSPVVKDVRLVKKVPKGGKRTTNILLVLSVEEKITLL